MATYKATIFIRDNALVLGDTDYTFNCHVKDTSTANAWERANQVAESLVGTVLPLSAGVYRVGVSNPDIVNGSLNKAVALTGTRVVTGLALPGWNVARVQFTIAEGVRVHTFFLRMGLTENDVAGQTLETAPLDAIADFIDAFTLTGANCDKDGFSFVSGATDGNVHMRQMGWRRRTRPGYKRGWVPA